MSDGGGESGRETEIANNKTKNKSRTDDFAQSIAKIAVAQVCESLGFQSFHQSALNTLSDVAVRYIREIGKMGKFYADHAGRTESNVFDIIQGLEDLGMSQGYSGAADINGCLADSGVVREIIQYVGEFDEIPYMYSIPSFPVVKDQKPTLSFEQSGETPRIDHIPSWLPVFPDLETFSPSLTEREVVDTQIDKLEPSKEQRNAERPLLNLHQQLACNGSDVLTAVVDPGDAAKAKQAAESNPFLAAPLRFGEKEVSPVVLPPKLLDEAAMNNHAVLQNHISALETFDPACEATKSTLCDSDEFGKKVLLNTRPTVQFKFAIGKKSSGTPMTIRNEGIDKVKSWFGDNNNKKRRAEQILNESMENTQELA